MASLQNPTLKFSKKPNFLLTTEAGKFHSTAAMKFKVDEYGNS